MSHLPNVSTEGPFAQPALTLGGLSELYHRNKRGAIAVATGRGPAFKAGGEGPEPLGGAAHAAAAVGKPTTTSSLCSYESGEEPCAPSTDASAVTSPLQAASSCSEETAGLRLRHHHSSHAHSNSSSSQAVATTTATGVDAEPFRMHGADIAALLSACAADSPEALSSATAAATAVATATAPLPLIAGHPTYPPSRLSTSSSGSGYGYNDSSNGSNSGSYADSPGGSGGGARTAAGSACSGPPSSGDATRRCSPTGGAGGAGGVPGPHRRCSWQQQQQQASGGTTAVAASSLFSTDPTVLRALTASRDNSFASGSSCNQPLPSNTTAAAAAALAWNSRVPPLPAAATTGAAAVAVAGPSTTITICEASAVNAELRSFCRQAAVLFVRLTSAKTAADPALAFAAAEGMEDFFDAYFVAEKWFSVESLAHSLCLVNRLTGAIPQWWALDKFSDDEDDDGSDNNGPVRLFASERRPEDSTDVPAFFSKYTATRGLLALLLLSFKFHEDITYDTERICAAMDRLRMRQKQRRRRAGALAGDWPDSTDTLDTAASASLYSSPLTTTAPAGSYGGGSSNDTSQLGQPPQQQYARLRPETLGQREQRLFKGLGHSVFVRPGEFAACMAAIRAIAAD